MEIKEIKRTGNVHSFRKQFYVTCKTKKRGWDAAHEWGWGVLSIFNGFKFPALIFHLLNFSNLLDTIPLRSPPTPPNSDGASSAQHLLWAVGMLSQKTRGWGVSLCRKRREEIDQRRSDEPCFLFSACRRSGRGLASGC